MMKGRNLAGMAIAASAAALFITAGCASNGATGAGSSSATTAKVACEGVNACKGLSDCKTANSTCAGHNDCKGLGIVNLTADECKKVGGRIG